MWQDELIRRGAEWRRAARAPALSVAVAYRGIEFAAAWGWADCECRIRATPDVRFACGSISKQFVAAAVLQLSERGTLALDAPVSDCVPGVCPRTPDVTVRHLLTHTAGVGADADALLLAEDGTANLASPAVVERWNAAAATVAPGQRWEYSNTGYFLLGLAVQRASGLPWAAYLRRCLATPGGIPRIGITGEPTAFADAAGYRRVPGGFGSVAAPSPRAAFASGDVFATARDLVRWTRALSTGAVVAPGSYAAMTTPAVVPDSPAASYGFAHYVAHLGAWRELSHDGNSAGFSSQVAYYPEADLAVAVLLNTVDHHAEQIARDVAGVLLGGSAAHHKSPHPLPLAGAGAGHHRPAADERAQAGREDETLWGLGRLAGRYRHRGSEVCVTSAGAYLVVRTPSGRLAELVPVRSLDAGDRSEPVACFVERDAPSMRYEFYGGPPVDPALSFRVFRAGHLLAHAVRAPDK